LYGRGGVDGSLRKRGFAESTKQCENEGMRKTLRKASIILSASVIFAACAVARQAPADSTPATPPQAPGTTPPPAKTPATKTPAAKTATTGASTSGATPTAKAQTGAGTPGTSGTKTPAAKTGTAKTGTAGTPGTLLLKTDKAKQSYAVGLNIGGNIAKGMQKDGLDVDNSLLARGIKDALVGTKPLMTDEEVKTTLTALTTVMRAKAEEAHKEQEAKTAAEGAINKSQGDAFLTANKTKEGVVTLPSGLQYKILQAGTGPKPTATDSVVCNYKGTLLSGAEFDSSYKRGQPLTIAVNHVIKGWTEALQLMPVGSKWELYVPSDLAYGPQSPGAPIGANSTLVFEVELLSIQPKVDSKAAPADPAAQGEPKQ
jgi:FKBP-type peptidyl-prolyl cis-trans isomerase FklB